MNAQAVVIIISLATLASCLLIRPIRRKSTKPEPGVILHSSVGRLSAKTKSVFHGLMQSPDFVEAMHEFADYQRTMLVDGVRFYVKQQKMTEASLQEGGAMIMEDLVGVLRGVAASHKVSK